MPFYAHTLTDPKTGQPLPKSTWEPLFTPFGEDDGQCQRDTCQKCENMHPQHGHLNKVAYWSAKFASEMFPLDSKEFKSAHQWGYLTGLWHDLGKFSEFADYLFLHKKKAGCSVEQRPQNLLFATKRQQAVINYREKFMLPQSDRQAKNQKI